MSNDTNPPSLSSLLTLVTGFLALAAAYAEIVSYTAARSYLLTVGVDPSSIGITPINAALKMTTTASEAAFYTIGAALIMVTLYNFFRLRSIQKTADAGYESKKIDLLIRKYNETPKPEFPLHIKNSGTDLILNQIHNRSLKLAKHQGRSEAINDVRSTRMIQSTAAIIIALALFIVYQQIGSNALLAGERLVDGDLPGDTVSTDLSPSAVNVQWTNPNSVPYQLAGIKYGQNLVFIGYLLGTNNGEYCFYFQPEQIVTYTPIGEVTVTRAIPSSLEH